MFLGAVFEDLEQYFALSVTDSRVVFTFFIEMRGVARPLTARFYILELHKDYYGRGEVGGELR